MYWTTAAIVFLLFFYFSLLSCIYIYIHSFKIGSHNKLFANCILLNTLLSVIKFLLILSKTGKKTPGIDTGKRIIMYVRHRLF